MAIIDDMELDYNLQLLKRKTGASATVYSSNAAYSFIQDTMDELGQLDNTMPMSAQTPTSYTMINGWYIQEELTQYLNGWAIQTSWYTWVIQELELDWVYASAVATDIGKQVTDDAVEVWALLDYNNTTQKWWIRSATTIVDNSVMAITAGTGAWDALLASISGENIFANPYTLGTIEWTPQLYIYQNWVKLTSWWTTGQFDILVKVASGWVDIDSKIITVFGRNWTDTNTNFQITLTTAGQNAVPLGNADDANNQNTEALIEDYTDWTLATVAIDFWFTTPFSYDIWDGNWLQDYEVQIDCNGQPLSIVYEVMKWWTRENSITQLETGADASFINWEAYRFANNTYAEVVASPLGTFAWGKAFMARSVYFTNLHADDAQAFQLIDKAGVARTPPNYQSVVINGVASWYRTAIYPRSWALVDKSQYTSHATLNAIWDSTFEMTTSLIWETPDASKFIVVATDELVDHTYRYISKAGAILTMPVSIGGTADAGWSTTILIDAAVNFLTGDLEVWDIVRDTTNGEYAYVVSIDSATQITTTAKTTTWNAAVYATNVLVQTYDAGDTSYVAYLLEEATWTSVSNTVIFATARDVLAVVRKKGILPFSTSGAISATGYSATAVITTDSIVT